ncbi:HPr kinase/phosphorylase [Sphingomonas japonica]|uniref:Serine kinase of HPr protein (Carbohydrate metabolism regulator) n=1 Tax=Sphingomonas japonica TaxID=511662 RepID=A0ABX0U3A1_9SPHN|nr:HPr kinase/phosphatase C-terminal domain-containing protein [Sphingomonas japonica]NIJ25051.1 serine kinase of HPr protein (carbohydrate metabolism regulator) [Sphingomonas japonica]
MSQVSSETVHASSVAVDGVAVLIEGRSGSGKSDLALRLIDRGGLLVSDDYTLCQRKDGGIVASAPATIAGQIEVRGVGIVSMEHAQQVTVALIVTIVDTPERMPEPVSSRLIAGVPLPVVTLAALEPSAPIKVEIALKRALAAG